jgi:DNA-binding transcriptional regulator PaaX
MSKSLIALEVLDLFVWGMDKLMQPTLHNLLAGYDEYAQYSQTAKLLERLRKQELLARHGHGKTACFTITAKGRARLPAALVAEESWQTKWDGGWRVLTFDLPMVRQRDRYPLWRAFRDRKLGLLQRSVWIWPRPLEAIVREILEAEGIPECFCGLEVRGLFLCTNAEVVCVAWDFEEIYRHHRVYLQQPRLTVSEINGTHDLAALAALARFERQTFDFAFSLDPLLPAELWPKDYRGPEILARHRTFRRALHQRLIALAGPA